MSNTDPCSVYLQAAVHRSFDSADAVQAVAALNAMREPPPEPAWQSTRTRVQIAVLMQAGGDLQRLHRAIDASRRDWRDTLVASGLADADWPTVAAKAGYLLPVGE